MIEQLLHDLSDWLNIYDPEGTKIVVSRKMVTNTSMLVFWADFVLKQRREAGLPDHVLMDAA